MEVGGRYMLGPEADESTELVPENEITVPELATAPSTARTKGRRAVQVIQARMVAKKRG